ncbi:hypothetical protein C0584_00175 [Candidatus Parcubacteria bacterium]|nr:MAG: hypothetical protein C0584_00175 [Candidatus Parcubacteria bacterium]
MSENQGCLVNARTPWNGLSLLETKKLPVGKYNKKDDQKPVFSLAINPVDLQIQSMKNFKTGPIRKKRPNSSKRTFEFPTVPIT